MGKKRSPEETLRRAKEKGAGRDTGIVDGKPHFKKIVLGTKNEYDRQVAFWHRIVQESLEENPDTPPPSPYDLRSLQQFVRAMACAIDGAEGIDEGCTETVRKYWNNFTAGGLRANPEKPEISAGTIRSVTNVCSFQPYTWAQQLKQVYFIKGPLKEEIGLTGSKRRRRSATKNHLLHFARQLWMADWFEYKSPATRLDDWLLHLANTFSSSRIGEYIESNCRPGSGSGLYYRVSFRACRSTEKRRMLILATFGAFINEYGNPEFAVQLNRDGKNMADTPEEKVV
ncbi:hypothetical protein LTR93_011141 [Exophiala xenobiotica]|nr:hypothetical protein LTR93_011141 [Exophiala xenobiotica]